MAAHLHDWGGYSRWLQKGMDHAERSVQVAEQFLSERGYSTLFIDPVLEAIKLHHVGDPNKRIEAILLSDADCLDFLGVVGVLRDFSKNPRDMRKAYDTALKRRDKIPQMIILDKSREIADTRIKQMDELMERFVLDSCNFF